jgi:hypothetical protein
MTTNDNITAAQIEQLRTEAAEAGDREQVRLCDLALTQWRGRGYVGADVEGAVLKCLRAINCAESMAAEGR